MQSIAFFDAVDIAFERPSFSLVVEGECPGPAEENIVTKSWRLLKETYSLPGEIAVHVRKNLPIGAGLAGGTGNGAAVFRAVATHFSLDLAAEYHLARAVGSDMPFCLKGGTALVEGTGERVTPLPSLGRRCLVLANPGFPICTPEIFAAFDECALPRQECGETVALAKAGRWDDVPLRNDLQAIAFQRYPRLKELEAWFLSRGLVPLMSGSGPSIFAFTSNWDEAQAHVAAFPGRLGHIWPLVTAERGVYHEREYRDDFFDPINPYFS